MLPRRFLLRFFELAWRNRWLHLVPMLIMTVAGVVFLLTPVYQSYASIYVQRSTLLGDLVAIRIRDNLFNGVQILTPASMTITELQGLIQTDAFAYAVISQSNKREELNGSARQVEQVLALYRDSINISAGGDHLVRIMIEVDDPFLAEQFATATLEAFRLWQISKNAQDGRVAQAFFDEVIAVYRDDLALARAALRDFLILNPEPAVGTRPVEELFELSQLETGVRLAESRLQDVIDKSEDARIAVAQSERDVDQIYRVIDRPFVPTVPRPLSEQIMLALIFPIVGVLISIIIILGRCATERTLLNLEDVRAELALPMLAEIGAAPRKQTRRKQPQTQAASMRTDEPISKPL
ncbi:MAG: hypothetical protein AB4911_05390 [Oscillochloridaceae bacterium umkhey_bin13]